MRKLIDCGAPVFVDNVNRFQALAEGQRGLASGARSFLIVDALIEGLGAGIIREGRIEHGAHDLSGEIGHMILDPDGYPCICGGRGCFEAMVSSRRLLENVGNGYAAHADSLIFSGSPAGHAGIEDVFKAFKEGDDFAKRIIDDMIRWFAHGLNNVVMVYDPEMIIIQGIYTCLGEYFLRGLRDRLSTLSLPAIRKDVRIEYSSFGPERGIIGGSLFVCQSYFQTDVWRKLSAMTGRHPDTADVPTVSSRT